MPERLGNCLVRQLLTAAVGDLVVLDRESPQPVVAGIHFFAGTILQAETLDQALRMRSCLSSRRSDARWPVIGPAAEMPGSKRTGNGNGAGCLPARRHSSDRLRVDGTCLRTASLSCPSPKTTRRIPCRSTRPASWLPSGGSGYSAAYGIHAAVARFSNLYGPRFSAETVVGRAIGKPSIRPRFASAASGKCATSFSFRMRRPPCSHGSRHGGMSGDVRRQRIQRAGKHRRDGCNFGRRCFSIGDGKTGPCRRNLGPSRPDSGPGPRQPTIHAS